MTTGRDSRGRQTPISLYYIHTEKYSPKSYVVNFHTQMSSSQSEERTMIFQVWEKWYVQSEATEVCEFQANILAFYGRLQLVALLQRRFAGI